MHFEPGVRGTTRMKPRDICGLDHWLIEYACNYHKFVSLAYWVLTKIRV
jgi:hypothetical protein